MYREIRKQVINDLNNISMKGKDCSKATNKIYSMLMNSSARLYLLFYFMYVKLENKIFIELFFNESYDELKEELIDTLILFLISKLEENE